MDLALTTNKEGRRSTLNQVRSSPNATWICLVLNPDSRGFSVGHPTQTLSHASPPATKAAFLDLTSSRFVCSRDDAPVVIWRGGDGFVAFNPINNQLANFFTRAVNHWGIFVHVVSATAIDSIVIRGKSQFPRR